MLVSRAYVSWFWGWGGGGGRRGRRGGAARVAACFCGGVCAVGECGERLGVDETGGVILYACCRWSGGGRGGGGGEGERVRVAGGGVAGGGGRGWLVCFVGFVVVGVCVSQAIRVFNGP